MGETKPGRGTSDEQADTEGRSPGPGATPIKHVLLDNHGLGKISKEQVAGDFPVWQTSLVNPDWAQFARLCGATGLTARSVGELDDAFAQLFAVPGPALLHIEQDTELV